MLDLLQLLAATGTNQTDSRATEKRLNDFLGKLLETVKQRKVETLTPEQRAFIKMVEAFQKERAEALAEQEVAETESTESLRIVKVSKIQQKVSELLIAATDPDVTNPFSYTELGRIASAMSGALEDVEIALKTVRLNSALCTNKVSEVADELQDILEEEIAKQDAETETEDEYVEVLELDEVDQIKDAIESAIADMLERLQEANLDEQDEHEIVITLRRK